MMCQLLEDMPATVWVTTKLHGKIKVCDFCYENCVSPEERTTPNEQR